MKVRQLFTNLARIMTVAIVTSDDQCRATHLVWYKKRVPIRALLEDAIEQPNIEKYFRMEVMPSFLDQLESRVGSEGIFVLEQPARVYFQVDEAEEGGISSHVAGEMQEQALPRLIAKLHECPAEDIERNLGALLASLFCAEFQKMTNSILEFRIQTTDQATIKLFA